MILTALFVLIAAGLAMLTYYLGGYMASLEWIFLPFLFALGYFVAIFLVYAIFCTVFHLIILKKGKKDYPPNPFAMWFLSQSCTLICLLLRVRVHANGLGKLPDPDVKFMVVSNHLSAFDHIALISLFGRHRFICVSKEANMKSFVAGGWITYAGYLPIKQGDIVNGKEVIEKAASYIKNDVCSVCIAPEGTRNKKFPNPQILPFHPGSFAMAYEAKCPIAVFAIQNTNFVWSRFPLRATHVYCDCVGVLEYDEYASLTPQELANKTQGMIKARFEKKEARFYHKKIEPEDE